MKVGSEFNKNVLTVLTGTTIAQAIPIAIAPILTRLYTPDDFGVFYLFGALTSILIIGSTGKYELAILIPEEKKDAINIAAASGLICTFVSLVLLLVIYFFDEQISLLLKEPAIRKWLYFIPFSIFINGWFITLNFWHNRHKRFAQLTQSQFLIAGGNAGSRLGLGYLSFGIGGLVLGTIIGQLLGLLSHLFNFLKNDKINLKKINRKSIQEKIIEHKNLAKNMVSGGMLYQGSAQIPSILLNILYSSSIVGFFGLMQRIIRLPLATIGRSFDEVFKQKASEELKEFGHCRAIFFQTLKKIVLITFVPFLILFFAAPFLFKLVFGAEWEIAGQYAQLFVWPFFLQFIVSSLTSIFYLTDHTSWYTFSHLMQFLLVLLAFGIGKYFHLEAFELMYYLAAAYGISYLVTLVLLVNIGRSYKLRPS